MNFFKRLIFLFVAILSFVSYNAGLAHTITHDCGANPPYGKCGKASGLRSTGLTIVPDFKESYVCSKDSIGHPYRVGFSNSCMVPAGDHDPLDTTCITTPNLIGEVVDTLTTVGIGVQMRKNFCSFKAGGVNMEGAMIKSSIFDQCVGSAKQETQCRSDVLRGIKPDGTHMKSHADLKSHVTGDLCEAMPNLNKAAVDSDGKYVFYNGKQVFCPIMRCNIPTDTMISKYYDSAGPRTAIMSVFAGQVTGAIGAGAAAIISELTGDCSDLVELGDGETTGVAMWKTVKLKGVFKGDKVCTKMLFPSGYTTLACKPRVIPKTYYAPTDNCYVLNSSCVDGEHHSKGFFPLTATLIECMNDLVASIFKTPKDSTCAQNPLASFQSSLKNTVKVLLVLYVILFGIRIAVGGTMPKKAEFFIFILKFALVSYFAVGGVSSTNETGLEQVYDGAIAAMHSFSNMVAGNDDMGGDQGSATVSSGLCRYDLSLYDSGYSYLALWDSLDCRLAFYLGFANPVAGNNGGVGILNAGVFGLIFPLMFAFAMPLLIFMLAFAVLLLSTVVYFTHVYVIALVAVSISIFLGPIFIPLALFNKTKGYFDKWLELTIAYTLYPAVITAFIAIMVTTYDTVIYKDCSFEGHPGPKTYWTFSQPISTECKESLGYIMSQLTSGSSTEVVDVGKLFYFNRIQHESQLFVDLLEQLMICVFFMFLFYYFSQQLSGFAADLSKATNIGKQAIAPTAVADKALSATKGKGKDDKKKDDKKVGKKGVSVSGKGKGAKRKGISVSKSK
jgi:type IV secretion system protein VirB6